MSFYLLWYFLIGALLGNGFPHFIWGVSNTVARSPFGQKSKPIVNICWGMTNFIIATLLSLWQINERTVTSGSLIALLMGFWLMVVMFGLRIKNFLNK